ncbi:MAG: hypothetical protein WA945_09920 [Arcobacteraceae bacterium]
MAGVEVEYIIVKDYSEKYEMDVIDTFRLVKTIASKVYNKEK